MEHRFCSISKWYRCHLARYDCVLKLTLFCRRRNCAYSWFSYAKFLFLIGELSLNRRHYFWESFKLLAWLVHMYSWCFPKWRHMHNLWFEFCYNTIITLSHCILYTLTRALRKLNYFLFKVWSHSNVVLMKVLVKTFEISHIVFLNHLPLLFSSIY